MGGCFIAASFPNGDCEVETAQCVFRISCRQLDVAKVVVYGSNYKA
jgi:hypothetical protein